MYLKKETQSKEIEYYQGYGKKIQKAFQNVIAIFKIDSIDFSLLLFFLVFTCRAYRICSRSLSISCAIIMVFSMKIFRNLNLGIEWFLNCKMLGGIKVDCGGARRVMVILAGNEHGDTSSNPGRDWLHFT